jgi:tRNA(adenine34) deaminase
MFRPSSMGLALEEARKASSLGEVPVGAVIVTSQGDLVSSAHNLVETTQDGTAHAELLAIREACQKLGTKWLSDCDLYVTLEPCAQCAGAIANVRLRRLFFGAFDPKSGGVDHGAAVFSHDNCHHSIEVFGGIDERACSDLLKAFFQGKRDGQK